MDIGGISLREYRGQKIIKSLETIAIIILIISLEEVFISSMALSNELIFSLLFVIVSVIRITLSFACVAF